MKTRSVKMKHFQSGGEFRAKWLSPNQFLSLDCALNYIVTEVNSLACWDHYELYKGGVSISQRVSLPHKRFQAGAASNKSWRTVFGVRLTEGLSCLYIADYNSCTRNNADIIFLFLNCLFLVGKLKNQENFGNQSAEQIIRPGGVQRDKCKLRVNWFNIWSSCGLLKTR